MERERERDRERNEERDIHKHKQVQFDFEERVVVQRKNLPPRHLLTVIIRINRAHP